MIRSMLATIAAALISSTAQGQTPAAPRFIPFDTLRIDSLVRAQMEARQLVGVSIGLMADGQTLVRSYGIANRATGARVDNTTRFGIGSVTKQFTCAIVLQLAAEGRLSIDDRVAKYFPRENLTRAGDITLRDLMSHVAGYPDYYPLDFVDRRLNTPIATDSVIRWYARQPLDFEPVTRWSYSNTGFLMLSRVAEMVTGRRFALLLQERIFRPLGMASTTYDPQRRERGYAHGHAPFALGEPEPVDLEASGWLGGAGGIFSTPEDLLKWDLALMEGRVVGGEWLREMTTERTLRGGAKTGYGLGIAVSMIGGDTAWAHGGGLSGFRAQNTMVPSARAAVVVLSNSEGSVSAGALLGMVMRFAPAPPRPATPPAVQPATPVPDVRGPSATEQARTLLRQMQAGRVDRAQLGEEFSWWLTDAKVTAAAPRLAALGEPTAVDQEARVERGGMEVTVTKFTFASTAINALMYRTPDGLVQQYLVLRR